MVFSLSMAVTAKEWSDDMFSEKPLPSSEEDEEVPLPLLLVVGAADGAGTAVAAIPAAVPAVVVVVVVPA